MTSRLEKQMGNLRGKTLEIIEAARGVLENVRPMTLRQVFYQLVSRQVIENVVNRYKALGDALVAARRQGYIPWEWIEDRTRHPRRPPMWSSVAAFASVAEQYRRNVWVTQDRYFG